ncbi:hypothetical protein HMPREF1246_1359 [Acidaminococcus sp. BV3L6]|uniref:Uncharacterized protein n=1 Tax=Acidaminococcus intestini (strain RyC-MR95) TaxID=568816 RepID=G4Q7U7_ACIIR|nr:hypothetical protein Acin_2425 [Acidaminococcus intestini RyC-MR95]ERL16366.1 hypothetical protein HMPREF1246_1359 [Acidaminococcus sp. BV3L6]
MTEKSRQGCKFVPPYVLDHWSWDVLLPFHKERRKPAVNQSELF